MSVTPQRANAGWVERRLSLEARDPTPFEDAANFWRATAQAATIVMCVLMLGVLLYLARGLLLPVLCAIAVGLTIGPMVGMLKRHGIPDWLTALVVVVGLIGAVNVAIVMLAGPASTLIGRAPEYGTAFAEKLHFFDRPLQRSERVAGRARPQHLRQVLRLQSVEPDHRVPDHRHAGRAAVRAAGRDVLRHLVFRHHGPQRLSQIRRELVWRRANRACAR